MGVRLLTLSLKSTRCTSGDTAFHCVSRWLLTISCGHLSVLQSDHLFAEFLGDHEETQSSVLVWVRTVYASNISVFVFSLSHKVLLNLVIVGHVCKTAFNICFDADAVVKSLNTVHPKLNQSTMNVCSQYNSV